MFELIWVVVGSSVLLFKVVFGVSCVDFRWGGCGFGIFFLWFYVECVEVCNGCLRNFGNVFILFDVLFF